MNNPYREPGKVKSLAEQMADKARAGKVEEAVKRANLIREFKAVVLSSVLKMIEERSLKGSQAMRLSPNDLIPISTNSGLVLCRDDMLEVLAYLGNVLKTEEYGFQVKTEYKRDGYSAETVEAIRIDWP